MLNFTVELLYSEVREVSSFLNNNGIIKKNLGSILSKGQAKGLSVKSYTAVQKELCIGAEAFKRFIFDIPQQITCVKFL